MYGGLRHASIVPHFALPTHAHRTRTALLTAPSTQACTLCSARRPPPCSPDDSDWSSSSSQRLARHEFQGIQSGDLTTPGVHSALRGARHDRRPAPCHHRLERRRHRHRRWGHRNLLLAHHRETGLTHRRSRCRPALLPSRHGRLPQGDAAPGRTPVAPRGRTHRRQRLTTPAGASHHHCDERAFRVPHSLSPKRTTPAGTGRTRPTDRNALTSQGR